MKAVNCANSGEREKREEAARVRFFPSFENFCRLVEIQEEWKIHMRRATVFH